MNDSLDCIISMICSRMTGAGFWSIKTDELIELLSIDRAEFYRIMYGLKDRIYFSDAIDSFSDDTIADLMTVLEGLSIRGVEKSFSRAGLFLDQSARIELMDILLTGANRSVCEHSPDYETFEAMMRVEGTFQKAFDCYTREYFSIDDMKKRALDGYSRATDDRTPLALTARKYLESLFQRHIITSRSLFLGLELKISEHFRMKSEGGRGRGNCRDESNASMQESLLSKAYSLMGLDAKNVTREELKAKYKSLMKKYHPDINPKCLELCKSVNEAYSLLVNTVC
jgi:hypothetical protein